MREDWQDGRSKLYDVRIQLSSSHGVSLSDALFSVTHTPQRCVVQDRFLGSDTARVALALGSPLPPTLHTPSSLQETEERLEAHRSLSLRT